MANASKHAQSINLATVRDIAQHRAAILMYMHESVNRHAASIEDELATLATLPAVERARHAIVFSIVSPQCPFDKNVAATPPLVAAIMNLASVDELRSILQANGIGLQNAKAKALYDASPMIRYMRECDVTRELLMTVRGVSMKASAMTLALFDQHARVYTLDTHMLRGIMQLAGMHVDGTYTITDAAYSELECFLLDVYDELNAGHSVFCTQWALWNDFGFKGQHKVHTPIFGF